MVEYIHVYGQRGDFTGNEEYTLTLDFFDADFIPTNGFKVQVLELGTYWTVFSVRISLTIFVMHTRIASSFGSTSGQMTWIISSTFSNVFIAKPSA
jgi:hypothetical protein